MWQGNMLRCKIVSVWEGVFFQNTFSSVLEESHYLSVPKSVSSSVTRTLSGHKHRPLALLGRPHTSVFLSCSARTCSALFCRLCSGKRLLSYQPALMSLCWGVLSDSYDLLCLGTQGAVSVWKFIFIRTALNDWCVLQIP